RVPTARSHLGMGAGWHRRGAQGAQSSLRAAVALLPVDGSPECESPLVLYVTFALLTWLVDPLFTLLLRLHRFRRLVVTDEDRQRSNLIGLVLLLSLLGIVAVVLRADAAAALVTGL